MTRSGPSPRTPFTIPLAQGPVAPWADRAVALLFVVITIVCLVGLWRTDPSTKGYDTHVQFGMQPCSWPRLYGVPCPTCGCTTAACLVVHGQWILGFVTQPFGAAVAIVGFLLGLHGLYCLLFRRSFADLLVRVKFAPILFGGLLLMLAAWYYKYLVFQP